MDERTLRTPWGTVAAAMIAAVIGLGASAASAAIVTWSFSGTLEGNTLNPDPIMVDGVAGTTQNLTDAGIIANTAFTATMTYDTATVNLLDTLAGSPPHYNPSNPMTGIYPTAGFNWSIGSLTARSAHLAQSMTYSLNAEVDLGGGSTTFLDVMLISGGSPPATNAASLGLAVRSVTADLNVQGDLGIVPSVALAMLPGTLSDNSQLSTPPVFYLDKGFSIPLRDTSTGQDILLSGTVINPAVGSAPSCGSFGGDTDGDKICNDVDLCVDDYDITQADTDANGIGNACNDLLDSDGDDWEDANDNCPDWYDLTNWCYRVPVLPPFGYLVLTGLLGLVAVTTLLRRQQRQS